MSTQITATATVECEVPAAQDIVDVQHNLNGPVDIVGYTAEGNRVGVIVNPIDENNADVIVVPGMLARLVVTLSCECGHPAHEHDEGGCPPF